MEDEDMHRSCFWTFPRKTNLRHMTMTMTVTVTKPRHNKTTQSGQNMHSLDVVHL
jgi:hypothetical protein